MTPLAKVTTAIRTALTAINATIALSVHSLWVAANRTLMTISKASDHATALSG